MRRIQPLLTSLDPPGGGLHMSANDVLLTPLMLTHHTDGCHSMYIYTTHFTSHVEAVHLIGSASTIWNLTKLCRKFLRRGRLLRFDHGSNELQSWCRSLWNIGWRRILSTEPAAECNGEACTAHLLAPLLSSMLPAVRRRACWSSYFRADVCLFESYHACTTYLHLHPRRDKTHFKPCR